MSDTSLPYGGTQGWSGTDTSQERAERDATDGTATERQRWVLGRLKLMGHTGITVAELREASGWHHGVTSSILTVLHKDQKISRLVERRGRCKVYVLPDYVDYRDESPYKPNSSHKDEVDRLKAGLGLLNRKYSLTNLQDAHVLDITHVTASLDADIKLILQGLDVRDV